MRDTQRLLDKTIEELLAEIDLDAITKNVKVEAVLHYKIIQQYAQMIKVTGESANRQAELANKQAKRLTCATWAMVIATIGLIIATLAL